MLISQQQITAIRVLQVRDLLEGDQLMPEFRLINDGRKILFTISLLKRDS